MVGAVQSILSEIPGAVAALAVTAILGVLVFPIRTFFKAVRTEWLAATEKLASVERELQMQRTNCLATIQAQGASQIKLQEDTNDILTKMHDSQLEMTGFIKARRDL